LKPTAIVTGGSRGIGRAIVEELVRTHTVVATYNSNREAAEALVVQPEPQTSTLQQTLELDGPEPAPIRVAGFLRHYAGMLRVGKQWDIPETMARAYESAALVLEKYHAESVQPEPQIAELTRLQEFPCGHVQKKIQRGDGTFQEYQRCGICYLREQADATHREERDKLEQRLAVLEAHEREKLALENYRSGYSCGFADAKGGVAFRDEAAGRLFFHMPVAEDLQPCSECGNEERNAAGYLTCECPARDTLDNRRRIAALLAPSSPADKEQPPKQPNPCPVCGTFLWGDTRPCWNCARKRAAETPQENA